MLHDLLHLYSEMLVPIIIFAGLGVAICTALLLRRKSKSVDFAPVTPEEEISRFLEDDSYLPKSNFGEILAREYRAVCLSFESEITEANRDRGIK